MFIGAVYSVPLDELRALPGSRKKKPARMIARDFIGREEIDEMFGEAVKHETDGLVGFWY